MNAEVNWSNKVQAALDYFHHHQDFFLEQLCECSRIPSVSFEGYDPGPVLECAHAVKDYFVRAGLENTRLLDLPQAYPYVFAERTERPGAPTVLLYAHYDVQPPMRLEAWRSPPFQPELREGRLYGRGVADDKAGIIVHLACLKAWLRTAGALPVNVRVLIEGEEETGSAHLEGFIEKYSASVQSDCMVLTDCANFDSGVPSLTTSLRGLVALDVTVRSMASPLHSGLWGGPLPDPALALAKMLSGLVEDQGRVADASLLAMVRKPTKAELESYRRLGMNSQRLRRQAGLLEGAAIFAEGEYILSRLWREPSLTVNSIQSGGKGIAGNVLMNEAWARIGLRLAPGMDPAKCAGILIRELEKRCPWGLELTVKEESRAAAWSTSADHPVFSIALEALSRGYGRQAVLIGCGGTIPFVLPLTDGTEPTPALLVGVEDPYTNAHSENESLLVEDFFKAVRSEIILLARLADEARRWLPEGTAGTKI